MLSKVSKDISFKTQELFWPQVFLQIVTFIFSTSQRAYYLLRFHSCVISTYPHLPLKTLLPSGFTIHSAPYIILNCTRLLVDWPLILSESCDLCNDFESKRKFCRSTIFTETNKMNMAWTWIGFEWKEKIILEINLLLFRYNTILIFL